MVRNVYDTNGRVTQQTLADGGIFKFAYTVNTDGTRTYTWDAKNRLTALNGPVTASFQYDALGRRLSKTLNGATTAYLHDGLTPVQELSGTTPTATLLTGLGIDDYYRRTDPTGPRDFLTDALGSVIVSTLTSN